MQGRRNAFRIFTGLNPNGIPCQSPGLRALPAVTQGSSFLATLGWRTKSLRDSRGARHSIPLLLRVEFPKGIQGRRASLAGGGLRDFPADHDRENYDRGGAYDRHHGETFLVPLPQEIIGQNDCEPIQRSDDGDARR